MSLFKREGVIERLCRESGNVLVERRADCYWARPRRSRRGTDVQVFSPQGAPNVGIQCFLGVNVPFNPEPPGLFARLMMRSFSLKFCSWIMTIGGSCEAELFVAGRLPLSGLDASLFGFVCHEAVTEVEDFQQELRDKFHYGIGPISASHGGFGQSSAEVQYLEPVREHLPQQHIRYRLPKE